MQQPINSLLNRAKNLIPECFQKASSEAVLESMKQVQQVGNPHISFSNAELNESDDPIFV